MHKISKYNSQTRQAKGEKLPTSKREQGRAKKNLFVRSIDRSIQTKPKPHSHSHHLYLSLTSGER